MKLKQSLIDRIESRTVCDCEDPLTCKRECNPVEPDEILIDECDQDLLDCLGTQISRNVYD